MFTMHVSDEQHPYSVANTNEPLVGVIKKRAENQGGLTHRVGKPLIQQAS